MHEKKTMARKRDEEGVSDIDRGFDVAVLVRVVISPVGGQEEVAVLRSLVGGIVWWWCKS